MPSATRQDRARDRPGRRAATAEVLQVINSSPGDLAPVFDAILEKAHSLCGVAFGFLQLYDSGKFRAVAVRGVPNSVAAVLRQPIEPTPGLPPARLLDGERIVQEADMAALVADGRGGPRAEAIIENGVRTALFVPLRKRRRLPWLYRSFSPGGAAVHRQADRAAAELRGAGGHRDGERAADHRDARGIGAADRDRRGACRSSIPRPATSRRCSTRYWRRRIRLCGAAHRQLVHSTMASTSARLRRAAMPDDIRRALRNGPVRRSRSARHRSACSHGERVRSHSRSAAA